MKSTGKSSEVFLRKNMAKLRFSEKIVYSNKKMVSKIWDKPKWGNP